MPTCHLCGNHVDRPTKDSLNRKRTCDECKRIQHNSRRRRYGKRHPDQITKDHTLLSERRAAKAGRIYNPRGSAAAAWLRAIHRRIVKLAIREFKRDKPTVESLWIERLRTELPYLYNPKLSVRTLLWRAKYNLDPAFRRKEITRTATRNSDPYAAYDDCSVTNALFCKLFVVKQCLYCGCHMRSDDKTLDHITPRALGGWHSAANVIVCCYSCNSKKRTKSPQAWLTQIDPARRPHVMRAWKRVMGCSLDQSWLFNQPHRAAQTKHEMSGMEGINMSLKWEA